jgi:3-methylfumaryl-CoA hydratase
MPTSLDLKTLQSWQGKEENARDCIALAHVKEIAATLSWGGEIRNGTPLPHLWHWAFFRPTAKTSELDNDGHPHRGGFLPSVPLPRRMWAGGRLSFHRPLAVGETIDRKSTISSVEGKEGRSGQLVFVTVRHDYYCDDVPCVTEEQDIVYREAERKAVAPASDISPARDSSVEPVGWTDTIDVTTPLLFRYSAVTFNSHRIHYDKDYAVNQEGYPGLVVHGPLAATLMLGALVDREGGERIKSFSFRGVRPLIAGGRLHICCAPAEGAGHRLWVTGEDGQITMEGTATFR